jgi:hypothetical protein
MVVHPACSEILAASQALGHGMGLHFLAVVAVVAHFS